MKKLDQIRRSPSEDICVLLRDHQGTPHVELRVYRRPEGSEEDSRPGPEGISIPVSVLQDLLRMLSHAQERLAREGPLYTAPHSQKTTTKDVSPDLLRSVAPRGSRKDSRQQPRAPVTLAVGCRSVSTRDRRPVPEVYGEIKDLSIGGAQVWLPERFSLFSRLEVSTRIGSQDFQGQAEVVGAEVHPTREGYRHSMRWLGLSNHAKATISQAISRI